MGLPVPQRQRATGSDHEGLSHDSKSYSSSIFLVTVAEGICLFRLAPEESAAKKMKTVHSSAPTQLQATTRNFTEIPYEIKLTVRFMSY